MKLFFTKKNEKDNEFTLYDISREFFETLVEMFTPAYIQWYELLAIIALGILFGLGVSYFAAGWIG